MTATRWPFQSSVSATSGLLFAFDAGTADADPGAGELRFNNATILSATQFFVSTTNLAGSNVATGLDQMDDSGSTTKSLLTIYSAADDSKWVSGKVTGIVSATGYRKISLSSVTTSGGNPFSVGEELRIQFSLTGDPGSVSLPDADRGDITTSASGATFTIDAGVVTTTKIGDAQVTFAKHAAAALGTAAEWRSNTADKLLVTDDVWSAAGFVALTDAATIAVDLSTGINFSVTLGGNRTLGNPTNTKVGQTGMIRVTQDGTGGRTLAFASNYKFAGGTAFSIDTTASRISYLNYFVNTSTEIVITGAAGVR
jgi:hypothetical protein